MSPPEQIASPGQTYPLNINYFEFVRAGLDHIGHRTEVTTTTDDTSAANQRSVKVSSVEKNAG
jgi:hypothetical protein